MDATTATVIATVLSASLPSLFILLTLMFNARKDRLRQEQIRKWAMEDRDALAAEVERVRAALAVTVETTRSVLETTTLATGDALTAHVTKTTGDLAVKVAEVGQETMKASSDSREAVDVANHSNKKLLELKEEISNLSRQLLAMERAKRDK